MQWSDVPLSIAVGDSLSGYIDLGDATLEAIIIPSTWTAAATSMTFRAAHEEDGDYYDVYEADGDELTFTVAGNRAVLTTSTTLADHALRGFRFLKIRSGTSATPVTQNNLTELRLLLR